MKLIFVFNKRIFSSVRRFDMSEKNKIKLTGFATHGG